MNLLERTERLFKKGVTEETLVDRLGEMTKIVDSYRAPALRQYIKDHNIVRRSKKKRKKVA